MIIEVICFILGALASFIVDIWWWTIDFRKAERGLEFHEHYHVGLELLILGLLLSYANVAVAYAPVGAGFGFIMAEWRQVVEITGRKVEQGHPFAYGSKHFRESTVFGLILVGILIALMLFRVL